MASPKPRRQGRRLARCLLAGIAGWLGVAACGLDDRVLTEQRSPPRNSGSICGTQGTTACETCLYRSCCEQAQVCGQGSSCATYLTCVAACSRDQSCEDACAVNYPSGFGDAVALSLCAQTACDACSPQARAFEDCDPTGSGACESSNDCAALQQGALRELDSAACPDCRQDVLGQACQQCLATQTGLSGPCSSCMAQSISCVMEQCPVDCLPDAAPGTCDLCLSEAGCTTQLTTCAFAD